MKPWIKGAPVIYPSTTTPSTHCRAFCAVSAQGSIPGWAAAGPRGVFCALLTRCPLSEASGLALSSRGRAALSGCSGTDSALPFVTFFTRLRTPEGHSHLCLGILLADAAVHLPAVCRQEVELVGPSTGRHRVHGTSRRSASLPAVQGLTL